MGLLKSLFPKWALSRELAKQRLEVAKRRTERLNGARALDATGGGRTRFSIESTSLDMDSEVAANNTELKQQIRQYELQNGHILGPFRRVVKNVVGHGIRLNAEIKEDPVTPAITKDQADTANAQIEKYMDIWNRQADKRLMQPFYGANGIQGMVEHTLLRDNEILVVGRNSKRPGRLIPYCLELLETDRLETPPSERGNPNVEEGIRYDDEGVQEAFYVLKQHPGNNISQFRDDNDYEEIPAYNPDGTKKVMFLLNPIRPEQTRAFSLLTSALKDVQDADRYMEAEKLAALEDACLFGTVTTDDVGGWDDENESSGSENYDRIHEFAPNEIKYLHPGEKFDVHRTTRPNTQFDAFIEQIWRGPANALDIPPEIFLQKWNDMNYSNARTVLLQFYATCRLRQQFLMNQLNYHVYENVLRWLVIKGHVQAKSFKARYHDWMAHSWIAPGWQWIDPKKEAEGKEIEIRSGLETVSDIMRSQGHDPQVKLERRAKELKYMQDLEAKYGVKFDQGNPVDTQSQQGDNEDD